MLTKLQIKLLSNSGELLNLVTCHAGQVSVFRGTSPSELRPYQRALTGSTGRERFSLSLDGRDFIPAEHTLIGFGEPPPHRGMTTREFLAHSGALDASIEGLLLAYGLEQVGDRACEELSPDEERRVRLIAATLAPDRILILNEPFEPISSTWRERCAESLVSFARSQRAIVIVTSLSHRPECWIDNESIERIQVGQTAQRTVGFRARSTTTTRLMQQLRQLLGEDTAIEQLIERKRSEEPLNSPAESVESPHTRNTAAVSASVAATQGANGTELPLTKRSVGQIVLFGGAGLVVLALCGVYLLGGSSDQTTLAAKTASTVYSPTPTLTLETPAPDTAANRGSSITARQPLSDEQPGTHADSTKTVATLAPHRDEPAPKALLLVDEYPEAIKVSLLETARGALRASRMGSEALEQPTIAPTKSEKAPAGNLFTLLEASSSKDADNAPRVAESPSSAQELPEVEQPLQSFEDIESRREEIRQKFLESIRNAAERRAQQGAE